MYELDRKAPIIENDGRTKEFNFRQLANLKKSALVQESNKNISLNNF